MVCRYWPHGEACGLRSGFAKARKQSRLSARSAMCHSARLMVDKEALGDSSPRRCSPHDNREPSRQKIEKAERAHRMDQTAHTSEKLLLPGDAGRFHTVLCALPSCFTVSCVKNGDSLRPAVSQHLSIGCMSGLVLHKTSRSKYFALMRLGKCRWARIAAHGRVATCRAVSVRLADGDCRAASPFDTGSGQGRRGNLATGHPLRLEPIRTARITSSMTAFQRVPDAMSSLYFVRRRISLSFGQTKKLASAKWQ